MPDPIISSWDVVWALVAKVAMAAKQTVKVMTGDLSVDNKTVFEFKVTGRPGVTLRLTDTSVEDTDTVCMVHW